MLPALFIVPILATAGDAAASQSQVTAYCAPYAKSPGENILGIHPPPANNPIAKKVNKGLQGALKYLELDGLGQQLELDDLGQQLELDDLGHQLELAVLGPHLAMAYLQHP